MNPLDSSNPQSPRKDAGAEPSPTRPISLMPPQSKQHRHRVKRMTLLRLCRLSEDNARFLLLAIGLVCYALCGAGLFMLLEADNEHEELQKRIDRVRRFRLKYPRVSRSDLNDLLEVKLFLQNNLHHGNRNVQYVGDEYDFDNGLIGVAALNRRWSFSGSLYFVYTLMTTTGFGMTTPRTQLGRAITVVFGFFGCTCTILFFNLFLERVITLLTLIITHLHQWIDEHRWIGPTSTSAQPSLGLLGLVANNPREIALKMQQQADEDPERREKIEWKPSLYAVFSVLFFMSFCAILFCSVTFAIMEETWTLLDSIYASFVAFATIGFGDFVPAFGVGQISRIADQQDESDSTTVTTRSSRSLLFQQPEDFNSSEILPAASTVQMAEPSEVYRILTILSLAFGTCCYYSLFNVSSILVKRFLTVIIGKFDVDVTKFYEKCCRRQNNRFGKARFIRTLSDLETPSTLDESEKKRRRSMIAHLRASAVDKAMARFNHDHQVASPIVNSTIQATDKLISANHKDHLPSITSKPESPDRRGSKSSRMTEDSSSNHYRSRSSGSLMARGRPMPKVIHPTVVDSDDEDGYGVNSDLESMEESELGQDYVIRSEALKKVGMMKNNAIVLAMMQKQLHSEQTRRQHLVEEQKNAATFGQPVGPLAIVKNLFE